MRPLDVVYFRFLHNQSPLEHVLFSLFSPASICLAQPLSEKSHTTGSTGERAISLIPADTELPYLPVNYERLVMFDFIITISFDSIKKFELVAIYYLFIPILVLYHTSIFKCNAAYE